MLKNYQIGGGKCSLCGSFGTSIASCPLNPNALSPNPKKHLKAAQPQQPVQKPKAVRKPKQLVQKPKAKPKPKAVQQQDDQDAQAAQPAEPAAPIVRGLVKQRKVPMGPLPRPAEPAAAAGRKPNCNNEFTIMGDETDDIPPHKLYVSPGGNCFNISDDLYRHLMAGNNTDPYNQQPLWTDKESMLQFLDHPGWEPEQKAALHDLLLSPLRPAVVDVLSKSPLFNDLYHTGMLLYSDYTSDFTVATEAIHKYLGDLRASDQGRIILDLRERQLGNPQTVEEILMGANSSCIHGVGIHLIKFYFDLWHMMPADQRPPLPQTVLSLDKNFRGDEYKNVKLVALSTQKEDDVYVMLYIYDWENDGQNSHFWYLFGRVDKRLYHHTFNGTTKPYAKYMVPIHDNILEKYKTILVEIHTIMNLAEQLR